MIQNALELNGLTKQFSGFTLDRLSLTLPSGCILGLVGENGAGKSTTIRLILGLLRKDGGSIAVLGREEDTALGELKEDLGVVLDEPGIPECLTTGQVAKVMALAYRQWDQNLFDRLVRQLAIPTDKQFKEFSQGNRRKLSIAVALAHRPKLLLLDEPTNGLDPIVRDQVVELLAEFTRSPDHSVLISSHITSDLEKICDYIAFLHRGKLLLCEEKDRLLSDYGLLHCTAAQLELVRPEALLRKKVTPYGVEALVRRRELPPGLEAGTLNLEDLFLNLVREDA